MIICWQKFGILNADFVTGTFLTRLVPDEICTVGHLGLFLSTFEGSVLLTRIPAAPVVEIEIFLEVVDDAGRLRRGGKIISLQLQLCIVKFVVELLHWSRHWSQVLQRQGVAPSYFSISMIIDQMEEIMKLIKHLLHL